MILKIALGVALGLAIYDGLSEPTRQYQSGKTDRSGRISRCGDNLARTLMYEAAVVILTRVKRASRLKDWALAIARRSGPGKSAHGACPQAVRHLAQRMAVRRAFQLG